MNGKILITGAAGFIGNHLVEFLLNNGETFESLRLMVYNEESLGNLPKEIAMGLSYFLSFILRIVGLKSPLFPSRVKVLTANCYFRIDKAKQELGYSPKYNFRLGASITGNWLLDNGVL